MKQKIVVKVPMKCNKCKNKAMRKAAVTPGVSSVAVGGDKVKVIGDGVDSVKLTRSLEKKFGFAALESVEVVKEKKEEKEDKLTPGYVVYPQYPVQCYEMPYFGDPNPSFCSIL